MSNRSIISRIENKLEDFLFKKIGKYEFGEYLINSVDALEGVDYDTVLIARQFQYKFEIADFDDEVPAIDNIEKVTTDFKIWIETLQRK